MASIQTPFNFSGGRVSRVTSPTVIAEQKIIDVLVTSRHERFGLPTYGVGIQQHLFEPIDELVSAEINIDAKMELSDRISDVIINGFSIEQDPYYETTAVVKVLYSLPVSRPRMATFSVSLEDFTEESPLI